MDNGFAIDREGTDRLEQFLISDRAPDAAMMLDELDGFVTGMVCAGLPVPLESWLVEIWGGSEPDYSGEEQKEFADLVIRLVALISVLLEAEEETYHPIYAKDAPFSSVARWARGFMRALALEPDVWDPVVQQRQELMMPLVAVASVASPSEENEEVRTLMQDEQMQQGMRTALPQCVQEIHDSGLARQSGPGMPLRRRTARTGRNDLCPCGSRKKFKKCCGG
ncbi:YecA/YgfB family protein [Thiohalomonas denitrificans]|uniref:SEC-C motif-containing protein n=1 Tax=Thiohalomonas denitrificans TaxID=415747 RepID=A0A1G5QVN4_9GAMM|nr:YecA family protein [Thiohalomonas denitrificans]SCZ65954.1 SEC-C motif-containing protein [Thiohalomonas denitrificans]